LIEYRHLRHFVEVAELLHVTAAAERLHIAQPALSQSIRSLEEQLHVTLFFRNKKRMVLTDAGRAFLLETRKSLEQFERAKALKGPSAGNWESLRLASERPPG
jgi:DNA-binding transcriptional LysR family regulator